jgi:ATP-dependent DNA helicase RecQ
VPAAEAGHRCRAAGERDAGAQRPAAAGVRRRRAASAVPPLRHGDAVRLPRFGVGAVVAIAADEVSVSFPDGSTRSFLRAYVEPLERPAAAD